MPTGAGAHVQVTQELGRGVVRTLGYVETPGETLQIVLEASAGSVLRMVEDGKFGAECAVCPRNPSAPVATLLLVATPVATLLAPASATDAGSSNPPPFVSLYRRNANHCSTLNVLTVPRYPTNTPSRPNNFVHLLQ